MGIVKGFVWDENYLQRVGFAVGALEYFCVLEENNLAADDAFETLWPSLVCAAMHIERAEAEELERIGLDYLIKYHRQMLPASSSSDTATTFDIAEPPLDMVSLVG